MVWGCGAVGRVHISHVPSPGFEPQHSKPGVVAHTPRIPAFERYRYNDQMFKDILGYILSSGLLEIT